MWLRQYLSISCVYFIDHFLLQVKWSVPKLNQRKHLYCHNSLEWRYYIESLTISTYFLLHVYKNKLLHYWYQDAGKYVYCNRWIYYQAYCRAKGIVTVCVVVRHLFSFYPFYFDFHSARLIFDVSPGFYLWNINKTTVNLPTEPYFL